MIVLIAACGYNWLQTQRLQGQIEALKVQAAHSRQVTVIESRAPEAQGSLVILPAQWQHYKQQFLHRAASLRSTKEKVLSYVKL